MLLFKDFQMPHIYYSWIDRRDSYSWNPCLYQHIYSHVLGISWFSCTFASNAGWTTSTSHQKVIRGNGSRKSYQNTRHCVEGIHSCVWCWSPNKCFETTFSKLRSSYQFALTVSPWHIGSFIPLTRASAINTSGFQHKRISARIWIECFISRRVGFEWGRGPNYTPESRHQTANNKVLEHEFPIATC